VSPRPPCRVKERAGGKESVRAFPLLMTTKDRKDLLDPTLKSYLPGERREKRWLSLHCMTQKADSRGRATDVEDRPFFIIFFLLPCVKKGEGRKKVEKHDGFVLDEGGGKGERGGGLGLLRFRGR